MNIELLRQHLHQVCHQIGASFTLEEAEGEIRACIVHGNSWLNLVEYSQAEPALWEHQLNEWRGHLIN
ncbi:MAG: hypothetical protein ACRCXB_18050 [Aeromonadaceae bacterium]